MTGYFRVENTYDEVLFAATQGLVPDVDDLRSVRVPAGEDESAFLAALQTTAKRIASLRQEGNNGGAREIAAEASAEYLTKFSALMPIPAQGFDDPRSIEEIGAEMFRR